jgi:hypothetical protein
MSRGHLPAPGDRCWLVAGAALGLACFYGAVTGQAAPAALAAHPAAATPAAAVRPAAVAAPAAVPDPTYAALRAARPDGRFAAVHNLALDRDAYHFEFESGTFHFLEPVAGRTVGAVFLGRGTMRLNPATPAERRQLALELGEGKEFEVFTDHFEELVLLFCDDTAQEIALAAPIAQGPPDPRARQVYERWSKRQRRDFQLNLQLRLARDLLNSPGLTSGVFLGLVEGKRLPPALLAVDPDGAEALIPGRWLGRETTLLYVSDPKRGGLWYLSDRRGMAEGGRRPPHHRLARALHYWVATTVPSNADLAGVTTIRLAVLAPGLRVLPINLTPKLRIAEAVYGPAPAPALAPAAAPAPAPAATSTSAAAPASTVAPASAAAPAAAAAPAPSAVTRAGPAPSPDPDPGAASASAPAPETTRAAAVIQEDAREDGADAAVVFPEPLAKGSEIVLRIAYHGDSVLTDAGDKNFVVESRTSWYPNLGAFQEPAAFDLAYRVPAGSQVVSVGRLVSSGQLGRESVSAWKSGPIRVAGFNYGQFKKLSRRDDSTGIEVEVYTNPGTPDILRMINAALESSVPLGPDGEYYGSLPQATLGHVNTARLAEAAMADGVNASRVFTTYFGPLADKHVAITQQSQFTFGQSWPSLIFMPYISFLDGTQRQRMGLAAAKDFVDQVGFHEFAHQWWGHLVAAESYRDLWLQEGFAEFSAALALQHTQGWGAYDHFWRQARKAIFSKPAGSVVANIDAGPLTQGYRLATERSPAAYQLVYEKGAYVLHMLRMLMWDGADPSPDRRFIAMMRDYASTYAGKEASTADFQTVVERHMVPAMDAAGNGKMDWFFRQWVYGTEAPRYVADLHFEQAGAEVHIKGKVTQQGVAEDFRALLPIYLELDRGHFARVGLLPMRGTATVPVEVTIKPPKKPRGVLINARGEVLARE